jgi:hypothetical protein
MVYGTLAGNVLDSVKSDSQLRSERFFFHRASLYNKKA